MASASTEPVTTDVGRDGRVEVLQAALERSERKRRALEEWAAFLEHELEARDAELEERAAELSFYVDELDKRDAELLFYQEELQTAEARLEAAHDDPGLWNRLVAWVR